MAWLSAFYIVRFLTVLKSLLVPSSINILSVPDIIRNNGYVCEVHHVTSKDGYVLELHRIPHGRLESNNSRLAVFVQHGLLSSSADWVIAGPNKALDSGYDVWLGNARGNKYSRQHISLDPKKNAKQFWNFSWHQIGVYDIPTMIDYVIENIKQDKIFYVGHSQGTTVFFVMCSEKPTYNNKIKAFFGLAPVAWTRNIKSPIIKKIAKNDDFIEALINLIGLYEFLPTSKFLLQFGKVCKDTSVFQSLCTNALFMVCGYSKKQMNASLLVLAMQHYPAGASSKQLMHYAQQFNSGHFRQWDYGVTGNIKHYGKRNPPDYYIKNIIVPVYLYCSRNDWLASDIDATQLYEELTCQKSLHVIPDKEFNHIDFIIGLDADNLVYRDILRIMKSEVH